MVPLGLQSDYTFPRYNPNPEDMKMLHAMSEAVLASKADVGFGFDGDGDRCGVVDNEGHEIFADKVGVMLARDLSAQHANAVFVADVKSTGLFMTDPVLQQNGARALYWKTGHLYMKRYTHEQKRWSASRSRATSLLPAAARPRLRRRPGGGTRRMRTCRPRSRQDAGRPQERPAQDGLAHHRRTARTKLGTVSSTRSPRSTKRPPPPARRSRDRRFVS